MEREKVIRELKKFADLKYRDFSKRLVFTKYEMIGVRLPKLKELAKNFDFFEIDKNSTFEEIMLYGFILAREKNISNQRIIEYFEYVDNWSVCDSFTCALKKNNGEDFYNFLLKIIDDYSEGLSGVFLVRFAIVSLMRNFLPQKSEQVLKKLNKINSSEYYINMAIAWVICEAIIKDYLVALDWLPKFDKFIRNKAISKCCDSFRISEEKKEYLKSLRV